MINKDKLKPVIVEAESGNPESIAIVREVLRPQKDDSIEQIMDKQHIFIRLIFINSLTYKDSMHHKAIDRAYAEQIKSYLNTGRPKYKGMAFIGYRESAKAQPLDTPILTPTGFKTMRDIRVGDFVMSNNGKKVQVLYESPIKTRDIYELKTEDGRSVECDIQHLWTVRKMTNVKEKYLTLDTQALLDSGLFYKRIDNRIGKYYNEYKYAIENCEPVIFETNYNLSIHPYLLGALLGNASMEAFVFHYHLDDDKHWRQVFSKFHSIGETKRKNLNGKDARFYIHNLRPTLAGMGLFKTNSHTKFIPEQYKLSSIEDRKMMLAGLLDTDGTVGKSNSKDGKSGATYSTVSKRLAEDVAFLVRSLGGRSRIRSKKAKLKDKVFDYFSVSIQLQYNPFVLLRKFAKFKASVRNFSRIVSIKKTEKRKEVKCIRVANNNGLYITKDFLVTHNTSRVKFNECYLTLYLEGLIDFTTVVSEDGSNADQFNMDMFNTLAFSRISQYYPNIISLEQKKKKESQTVSKFTTLNGVTYTSSSARKTRRGAVKVDISVDREVETKRPKKIIFDDIENETTIMSAVNTSQINRVMNATIDGLDQTSGSWILIGNYLSLRGNVAKFINKFKNDDNYFILLIPIIDDFGQPTWEGKYVRTDKEEREFAEQGITRVSIETIQRESDNFDTEYLNNPSRSSVYFADEVIEALDTGNLVQERQRDDDGLLICEQPNKNSVYIMSVDCAKGNKGDQSAFTVIKTNGTRYEEVANFMSNEISPENFAPYSVGIARRYNTATIIPENNYPGNEYIAFLSPIYNNIFISERTVKDGIEKVVYGVNTNIKTKTEMFLTAKKILSSQLFVVNSQVLYDQFAEYPKQDINTIIQKDGGGGHWDILMSTCIGLYKAGVIGAEIGKYDTIDLILNDSINKVFKGQQNNK